MNLSLEADLHVLNNSKCPTISEAIVVIIWKEYELRKVIFTYSIIKNLTWIGLRRPLLVGFLNSRSLGRVLRSWNGRWLGEMGVLVGSLKIVFFYNKVRLNYFYVEF